MSKKIKLLTTCIVGALHPNEQQAAGAVWQPDNHNDEQEAQALINVGYAKEVNEAVTHQTVSQRQSALTKVAKADPDDGIDAEAPLAELLEGTVDDVTNKLDTTELTVEQLKALANLEAKGKSRKGVQDAIAQYLDAE